MTVDYVVLKRRNPEDYLFKFDHSEEIASPLFTGQRREALKMIDDEIDYGRSYGYVDALMCAWDYANWADECDVIESSRPDNVEYYLARHIKRSDHYVKDMLNQGWGKRPLGPCEWSLNPGTATHFRSEFEADIFFTESPSHKRKWDAWRDAVELVPIYKVVETGNASLDSVVAIAGREPVYFLYSPLTKQIKIGKSWDIAKRKQQLQTGAGIELTCLAVTTRNSEGELHNMFTAERKHGEWFEASPRLCGYIASINGIGDNQ